MRRWYPFIILMIAVFVLVNFLLLTGQENNYTPLISDPAIVYQEACQECHGKNGKGEGLLYPDISDSDASEKEVFELVRNGALLMPAFPNIPDSTLGKLARYVYQKKYAE